MLRERTERKRPASFGAIDAETTATYLHALLHGQRQTCQAIVKRLLAQGIRIRDLHVHLFQHSLYAVGSLWEAGRVSVATEHMATAITEWLLTLVYPQLFAQAHVGRSAIVSCTASEYHQIGGKIVADTFELNGWHGYFLGANTAISELLRLTEEKRPDVIALSLAMADRMDALVRTAGIVRERFPSIPIWVGGQAFRWGGHDRVASIDGVSLLDGLAELEQRLQEWPVAHG